MSTEKAQQFRSSYKKNVKTAFREKGIPTRGPNSPQAQAMNKGTQS